MALFRYKGRDKNGKIITGDMVSFSQDTALKHLARLNVIPLHVETINPRKNIGSFVRNWWVQRKKIQVDALVMFCKQMHALLKAGVPVSQALRGIAENQADPWFRDILIDISIAIDGGRDLSTAMLQHPHVFHAFMINILRIGESTGRLDAAFEQMGIYLQWDAESTKRIKSAFRYPALVFGALCVAVLIMNFWVIPQFAKTFATFHAPLPPITRFLIALSDGLVTYWPIGVLGIGAGVAWLGWFLRTAHGQMAWSRLQLRLPIIGRIVEWSALARFARSFALTSSAGVPILQAFDLLQASTHNAYMASKMMGMRHALERGESILRTAQNSGLFSPLVLQMIAVGEETGEMEKLMRDIADYYESHVDFDIKKLSQSIEPILMAIMGIMVAILAFGIFLPMWSLGELVQSGG